MNYISFTHCSASKVFDKSLSVLDLNGHDNIDDISNEWISSVNKSAPVCPVKKLYNGGGFKKLSKNLGDKHFFVVSAGLGLLHSNDLVPSYECTVSIGKPGSIVDRVKEKFDINKWWKILNKSKFSRGLINENIERFDYILISLTSDYLKMVAEDLKLVSKNFFIFTGSKDLAIELGFEKNLMPYTEVFDGPDGTLRGTNRDFPQRTHADFLRRIKQFGNFEAAFKSVEDDMNNWVPPIKHNNTKKTNEEILNLIKSHEGKFTKVSDLLHYFRYELKVACEERRFKSLYKNFKEQRHV